MDEPAVFDDENHGEDEIEDETQTVENEST